MSAPPQPTRPARAGSAPAEPRAPLDLAELLDVLVARGLLEKDAARDVAARATTLRSRVLKQRVGSVRSQAAARYDVTPAEIVAAADAPNPKEPRRALDEDAIAEAIADAAGAPYVKIDPLKVDGGLVTKTLSRPFARRHVVLPLAENGPALRVAMTDPHDSSLRESLESLVQRPLEVVVASKRDILAIIDRVYGFRSSVSRAQEALGAPAANSALVQLVELRSNDELASTSDEHVIAAVDYLLNYAFDQRASDIHLEPRETEGVIRFRIDGILHDIENVPYAVHAAITSRIKVLARMDIAERRRPQDGRIKTQRSDREVELRVSSLMTAYGEKVVIRVFDPSVLMADLQQLGFQTESREMFERWITSPSGLVLVTGPTGSGKTTTLYATLRYLAGPEVNITTVEDPIEMVDPRFCQVQVQRQIDVSFASALRTILRQDPDVIMVGEIRDTETATIAVQAALTGHKVLSTLHTNDSAGAVTRFIDMGIEPFLVASTMIASFAQRLVRTVCTNCKRPFDPSPEALAYWSIDHSNNSNFQQGEGCFNCMHTGYKGRTGIYEVLLIEDEVQQMILKRSSSHEIARTAKEHGSFTTLKQDAAKKIIDGVTTFEEAASAVLT